MRLEDYKTRVLLVELVGYREWTESLGSSREWLIQETQATMYRELQRASWRLGYFTVPARFDYIIIIAPNASTDGAREVLDTVASTAPTPVRAASVCAETLRESERESFKLLLETELGAVSIRECWSPEAVAIAHVDFNNIREVTMKTSPLEALEVYTAIHSEIARAARQHGGIAAYLGGDNTIAALPPSRAHSFQSLLREMPEVKAGIGLAKTARRAIELATAALDETRRNPGNRVIVLSSI